MARDSDTIKCDHGVDLYPLCAIEVGISQRGFPEVKGWLEEDLGGSLLALKCLVWFMKYYANVRRTVADFSHAPLNEYSPSPDDKKQWSLGCWFGGKLIQKLRQKGVYEESFSRHAAWIGGKLIQFMHTTMVPVQVKTMKIQAGIQVSRPRELTRQLQLWKRFGRLYYVVSDIQEKDKNNGKTDKAEHGNEKSAENQSRRRAYLLRTNPGLFYWEVIKNGNKVLNRTVGTVEQEYEPTTIEEKQDRRNEMKARATLLMALPNKDQLKFHSYQDAKLLMEAIEKRKSPRSQLEIQGEVINQEDMNLKLLRSLPSEWKTHALIWRNKVEIETISLDDLHNNLKIYESELTGSASTSQNPQNVAFVSNNTNNNNITNEADNTTYGVSTAHTQSSPTSGDNLSDAVICAFLASQPNSPQMSREDLEQIDPDDLEEMDLQWEMAMLTIRARRFIKRTGKQFPRNHDNKGRENNTRTIIVETPTQNALIAQDGIGGYDWSYQAKEEQPTNYALMAFTSSGSSSSSDSEVDSCSKTCLESVEARLAHYKKNDAVFEKSINVLKLEVRLRDNALDEYKINLEKAEKERDQLKQTLEKFQNSSKSLNDLLESQVIDKFKIGLGYNAATAASPAVESFVNLSDKSGSDKGYHSVPPPLTGNFIPRKPDITFIDEIVESENMDVTTVVTPSNDKTVESKGVSNTVKYNAVRMNNSSAPIIEDWNSDDESEIDYTVRPSTEKIKSIKTLRETDAPKQNKHHPRGNQRN
ncbi:hypothetical protein Tco_0654329 [Tanacetum coccineum]|uniref:Uncharacterized protein n=1 Tax=Tanacetum coccineum TaxID=301880 RepID=A0ABQ4X3T3_9ASTR